MPDVLHWLGVRRIHRLVSMSNMKYDAIVGARHRGRRARQDSRRPGPGGRARRDGRQEGRRLLHRRRPVPDARTPRARPRAAACDERRSRDACAAARRRCAPPATMRERCAQHRRGRDRRGAVARISASTAARLDDAAARVARGHAPALSGSARFRTTAAGGISRPAASIAAPSSTRARRRDAATARARDRPDRRQRAARRRRRPGVALRRSRRRASASRARKGSASRASAPSWTARSRAARRPLRVDAEALARHRRGARSRAMFQVDDRQSAGRASTAAPRCCAGWARAGASPILRRAARPGALLRHAAPRQSRTVERAARSLRALLDAALRPIWLTGSALDGDSARRRVAPSRTPAAPAPTPGWVPFHKLSQWLAYSLLEPFEWAGVAVTDRDALTGAARIPQRRPAARHRRARAARSAPMPPPRGTSAASWSSNGAR